MPVLRDRWDELIVRLKLDISKPVNFVTAKEIHRHLAVEPRLLASMDSSKRLPPTFSRNGIFVVPLSRERYALVHGKGYHELEDPGDAVDFEARLPTSLATLAYGSGENRFLLHAYHSGLISHFSGVASLYQTVSGKMGSKEFSFHVDGSPELSVQNAGMELDAGYEGAGDILLFEGKATPRTDFLIRQLYYPYRAFRAWVPRKRVRPFFFVADPDEATYTFWEYEWSDPSDYEAIRCVRAARFRVVEARTPPDDLEDVAPDPAADRVPQADDLSKVVELPILIEAGIATAQAWSKHYDISPRQGSYYRQAAEALGFVRLEEDRFALTPEGRRYVGLPQDARERLIAERLLRNPLLNAVFVLVRSKGEEGVGDLEVARMIETRSRLRGSTPLRRAKTVRSYFRWLGQATGAVFVENRKIYSRQVLERRLGLERPREG